MRKDDPWELTHGDLELLGELEPELVLAAWSNGFPNRGTQRDLLGTWWRKVTGWSRQGPQIYTGPVTGQALLTARLLLPRWWLRRSYGLLEGRAAAVHAVYAHRVRDGERRSPPAELTALAARLLASGDVVDFSR